MVEALEIFKTRYLAYATRVGQMMFSEENEEIPEEELLEDESVEIRGKKRRGRKHSTLSDFVC